MARISVRNNQSVRVGGKVSSLDADAILPTVSVNKASSVEIAFPSPSSSVLISPDTFNQLQNQNAIAVVTQNSANKLTISFYQKPSNYSGALISFSMNQNQAGNPQTDVTKLTSKNVTLANATFGVISRIAT